MEPSNHATPVESPAPVDVEEQVVAGPAKPASRPQIKSGSSNPNMNGPLYMQTSGSNNVILVRRLKRKEEGTWKHLARWLVENQIGLSLNLLALLFCAHIFIPKARAHTTKFFHLAYYDPETNKYGVGFDDLYFVTFCVVAFFGLRAGTMEYILAPFAKSCGIARKGLTRFSEQAWMLIAYLIFWPLGLYIYCNGPHYMSLEGLWSNWGQDRELDAITKGYFMAQAAFWLQQMVTLNIEEKRKDHWQMFSHHVITITLVVSCVAYHQTRVGNLILILMDIADVFLPLAKCLKYCKVGLLCDVCFGLFMLSWMVARHGIYSMVCWSVYAHTPIYIGSVCYRGQGANMTGPHEVPEGSYYMLEPFLDRDGYVCYNDTIRWGFLAPLLLLQVLLIAWFTLIVRVAVKVVRGEGAEDNRSEDEAEEDEEEEEEEFFYEEAQPLEEEVGVEALDLKNWERRSGFKRQASSSGVSIPGHSDRKELLGRIGCEKQVE